MARMDTDFTLSPSTTGEGEKVPRVPRDAASHPNPALHRMERGRRSNALQIVVVSRCALLDVWLLIFLYSVQEILKMPFPTTQGLTDLNLSSSKTRQALVR